MKRKSAQLDSISNSAALVVDCSSAGRQSATAASRASFGANGSSSKKSSPDSRKESAGTASELLDSDVVVPAVLPFKRSQLADRYPKGHSRGRHWKHLKQIIQAENYHLYPADEPTYISIEAPPSMYPAKKYCDITGFEAPYTDPRTKLRYSNPQVGSILAAQSLSEALTMTTVLPSSVAFGVVRDPGRSVQTWKPLHNWMYSVIPRAKRVSFLCLPHQLQFCSSNTRGSTYQDDGRALLNMPESLGGNFGYGVYPALLKHTLSGWMKSQHAPSLCPPVTLLGRVLPESGALTVTSEAGEEIQLEDSDEEADDGVVVQETLNMFEWRAICAQVAQFASTPMGMSIARDANLIIGANKLQSEGLLEQTADACALSQPLNFSGIENLQGLVAEAISGTVCAIKDLCSVRNTLIVIQSIHDQLCDSNGTRLHSFSSNAEKRSSLQALISDCDLCSDLVSDFTQCLDFTLGTVLDKASRGLAAARLCRQENMRALEALLKETAAFVVRQGGANSVVVTRRCTRLCIAVRSSHKSLLPGGVALDVSNTGTTSFMEPEPAMRLNNEENRLAAAESAEEIAVLKRLTLKLVDKADLVMDLLGRITVVDLACARASHARWLGSVSPSFYDSVESGSTSKVSKGEEQSPSLKTTSVERTKGGQNDHWMVHIEGMRHPLLLGAVLHDLQTYGTMQTSTPIQSPPCKRKGSDSVVSESKKLPVAIDIKVKAKVRVVTITGPNTGGKTATLKAFGVAAIMAKAGLFLPAAGQPMLPWFDMILADVGDVQSLEQSLSTFSGHIRRLCSILEICTHQSLILLDEVGGGTDPSEGAALATAVLQHLSSQVWLTISTTHSADLKTLKDQDPRFENASVEFDVVTLKPTYRVLWGVAGQSNALDIAESLGFDPRVLTRAREMVGKLLPSQLGVRTAEVVVPLMKQRDELLERFGKAAKVLCKAQELHYELEDAAYNLPKREAAWRRLEEHTVQSDIASAKLRMDMVINSFQETMEQEGPDSSLPSMREAHAEIASILEEFALTKESTTNQELFLGDKDQTSGVVAVGEKVLVRKLGETSATVIEVPRKDSDFLTVQLGTLKMQVKSNEVLKFSTLGLGFTPAKPDKMSYSKTSMHMKSETGEVGSLEPKYEVAVKTSKNSLELRGKTVVDAIQELNTVLASKRPQSVLFVVHGIGTGAVKEAVLQTLRKHPFVAKFEEESITNGGCTVVYVK